MVTPKMILNDVKLYDAQLFHCAYKIVVCSVFNIILRVLVFYQKQNVSALISI